MDLRHYPNHDLFVIRKLFIVPHANEPPRIGRFIPIDLDNLVIDHRLSEWLTVSP